MHARDAARCNATAFNHLPGSGMPPEITQSGAAAGAAVTDGQTAKPEQDTAGLAQPQSDTEGQPSGQPTDAAGEAEKLTDEQKAIRKLQRRVERLTARRGGLERENELLRQELERRGIRQQQSGSQDTGTGTDDPGGETRAEPAKPATRQLTADDIERLAEARARELHQRGTIAARVGKVLEVGSKLDGFNAAVDAVAEVLPFTDRQGRPSAFVEAVLDADDPAALLLHLGTEPDELDELIDLTPSQLGRRLSRIEDRLKAAAKQETSAAPKPLKPVSTSTAAAAKDPSRMTDAEFTAWRREQIAKRGSAR